MASPTTSAGILILARLLTLARTGLRVARDALAKIEAAELADARQVVEFAAEMLEEAA